MASQLFNLNTTDQLSPGGLPLIRPYRSMEDLSRSKATASTATALFRLLEAARAHEATVKSKLQGEKLLWQQASKSYRKSQKSYEAAVNPSQARSSVNETIAEQRALSIDERGRMESKAADVRHIREKLHAARRSRELCERDFIAAARQWTKSTAIQGPSAERDLTTLETSSSQQAFHQTPPASILPNDSLLERYQQKIADVDVLGEKLAEQSYNYWEAFARRQLRQDRNEDLSWSDDDFQESSRRQKEAIEQELKRAMEEVEKLKATCSSAGIDFIPHVRNVWNLDDEALTNAEFEHREEYQHNFEAALSDLPPWALEDTELIRDNAVSDTRSDSPGGPAANDVVEHWMENVSLDGGIRSTISTDSLLQKT